MKQTIIGRSVIIVFTKIIFSLYAINLSFSFSRQTPHIEITLAVKYLPSKYYYSLSTFVFNSLSSSGHNSSRLFNPSTYYLVFQLRSGYPQLQSSKVYHTARSTESKCSPSQLFRAPLATPTVVLPLFTSASPYQMCIGHHLKLSHLVCQSGHYYRPFRFKNTKPFRLWIL